MKEMVLIKGAYLVAHRCYKKVSALRFAKSRKWYTARLRSTAIKYRVSIINYLVAVDGIYFICVANHPAEISAMMQALQSSASRQFASKRGGESAMWQGRFDTTVIHGRKWVKQCMLMLDLHTVATDQVNHPAEWEHSGWHELVGIKKRNRVISVAHAMGALGDEKKFETRRTDYVRVIENCCLNNSFGCLETWTNALAMGSSEWISKVSESIPEVFRTIDIVPKAASPLNEENDNTAALKISKKRRRCYLNRIL